MDTRNLLFLLLALALTIEFLCRRLLSSSRHRKISSPPPSFPILGNLLLLFRPFVPLGKILSLLSAAHGPAVTLYAGVQPIVYIVDRGLAHQALVENAAAFANRPPASVGAIRIYSGAGHTISTAAYGPLWRLLRRNLTSGALHPSRTRSSSRPHQRALTTLVESLKAEAELGDGVVAVYDNIHDAVFRLLVLMCFGDVLTEEAIRDLIRLQSELSGIAVKLFIMNLWPTASKVFLRRTWNKLRAIKSQQEAIISPLIRAVKDRSSKREGPQDEAELCYLDTLVDLEPPDEGGRKLNDDEIINLCSEFLMMGTEGTSTTLLWIMANLVKQQGMQSKLRQEIREVGEGGAGGDDLEKATYLKAVVLEALRRHPPAHFVPPHMVSEDVLLEKYVIPKGALVNVAVGEIGRDERVWEEPMEFRPERFMAGGDGEGVDVTGSREIKMIPFGAGRRICPGMGFAMLNLEHFAAKMVAEFEWRPASEGEEVDMAEKKAFPVLTKRPLRARIVPRRAPREIAPSLSL